MRWRMWVVLAVLGVQAAVWTTPAAALATVRWGSEGSAVRVVQAKLKNWGYYDGPVDGMYGRQTYAAVVWFQRRAGLTADGLVGPRTWAALGEASGPDRRVAAATAARGVVRQDDRDLLARVVAAEARGEPYVGQVAVAAVVLNRMRDPRFPDSLAGVIYQPHAFESVTRGAIYRRPTAESVRAAADALSGWDPSGGAVFFWNPAQAVSQWIWTRPVVGRIGHHVFGK